MRTIVSSVIGIIVMMSWSCSSYQSTQGYSDSSFPGEPGKCYAKCLIPDQYDVITDSYAVYTGPADDSELNVEKQTIVIKPASKTWEKRRSDNCRSANPDDCLIWCLVDIPEQTLVLPVVLDTNLTSDFEWRAIDRKILIKAGGSNEWREVICQSEITTLLIRQLQIALQENGYFKGGTSNSITPELKSALTQFQKDHSLPVGQLDMETLEYLDIHG